MAGGKKSEAAKRAAAARSSAGGGDVKKRKVSQKSAAGAPTDQPVGQGPLCRPPAAPCRRCGAAPGSVPWYYYKKSSSGGAVLGTPLDDKCKGCHEAYLVGFAHRGSWEEIADGTKEDPELAGAFDIATQVQNGATPNFFQESVDRYESQTLDIEKPLIGLSHEQVRAAFGGKNPEEWASNPSTLWTTRTGRTGASSCWTRHAVGLATLTGAFSPLAR